MCVPWLPRIGYFKDYIKATKRPPSVICIQSIFGYLSPLVLYEPPDLSLKLFLMFCIVCEIFLYSSLSGTPCTWPLSHSFLKDIYIWINVEWRYVSAPPLPDHHPVLFCCCCCFTLNVVKTTQVYSAISVRNTRSGNVVVAPGRSYALQILPHKLQFCRWI